MDTNSKRHAVAEQLRRAQHDLQPCAPPTDSYELDEFDAYAIQQLNIEIQIEAGAQRIGWKVGLTSDAIQSWLQVDEPDYGALLDDMLIPDSGAADTSRMLQPRAEGELAFVLREDLGAGTTAADVLRATAFLLPAIEVIDSRVADWKIKWADTVADNASSGMFVVGSTPIDAAGLDLRRAGMVLRKNGAVVSTGAGAACLGHPVNAVAWLANKVASVGDTLKAGDIVLSGALGPVTPVQVGDWLDIEIAHVGSTSCRFV